MSNDRFEIGTTQAIFVPKPDDGLYPGYDFQPGNYYITLGVHSAKIRMYGGFWKDVDSVAITSDIASLDPGVVVSNINKSMPKGFVSRKGILPSIKKNLVGPLPATMRRLDFAVKMVVSRGDPAGRVTNFLKSDALSAALSFAPGALKTIGVVTSLAPSAVDLFKGLATADSVALAGEDYRMPGSEVVQPGYILWLATQGNESQADLDLIKSAGQDEIKIDTNELIVKGKPVDLSCYIVLEIKRYVSMQPETSDSPWVKLYLRTKEDLTRIVEGTLRGNAARDRLTKAEASCASIEELMDDDLSFTQLNKSRYSSELGKLYAQAERIAYPEGARTIPPKTFLDFMPEMSDEDFERLAETSRRELQSYLAVDGQVWLDVEEPQSNERVESLETSRQQSPIPVAKSKDAARAAVFVSDLHLGRKDRLEDFTERSERAFAEFIDTQSMHMNGWVVDLVILGDFLDIWQIASEAELNAEESTSIDITLSVAQEHERVSEIVSKHRPVFEAIGRFVAADPERRRVVCVPGNHDHSLLYSGVQAVIRDAIAGGSPLGSRVIFPLYYDQPELRVYAEHGSQIDPNNRYASFQMFGTECSGFYFTRIFWNRMEAIAPNVESWWSSPRAIIDHKLWKYIPKAYALYRQYMNDPRPFPRVSVASAVVYGVRGEETGTREAEGPLMQFPDILLSEQKNPARVFSSNDEIETAMRQAYQDDKDFRRAINEVLEQKYGGQQPAVPSSSLQMELLGLPDPYVTAAAGMFSAPGHEPTQSILRGTGLDPRAYDYVVLGHTHGEKRASMGHLGATYLNTGSWTCKADSDGNDISKLTYVVVTALGGEVSAELKAW